MCVSLAALLVLLTLSGGGCCSVARQLTPPLFSGLLFACPKVQPPAPFTDDGPYRDRLLNKDEVLAVLNRRADAVEVLRVPNLTATADIERFRGEELTGYLAVRKPRHAILEAQKPLVDKRLGLGSNDTEIWFFENFSANTAYFTRWENLGRRCARRLPLEPTQVIGLLGIYPLREDPLAGPFISVIVTPREQLPSDPPTAEGAAPELEYVLHVQRFRDPARPDQGVYLEREIRLSRGQLAPRRVRFYRPDNGLPLLVAELRGFAVEGDRFLPTQLTLSIPVYDETGLVTERTDTIQLTLATLDADGRPKADALRFDAGYRLDENGQPKLGEDGRPIPITPEQFLRLFDPDERVRPYVEREERLDSDCDRPAPVGPAKPS